MLASTYRGLSPYARGTQMTKTAQAVLMRFIPVCTGNTVPARCIVAPVAVYPRMHGEHQIPSKIIYSASRFIPVCTGNTMECWPGIPYKTVYPRMHGEHTNCRTSSTRPRGLSPYARGTRERP